MANASVQIGGDNVSVGEVVLCWFDGLMKPGPACGYGSLNLIKQLWYKYKCSESCPAQGFGSDIQNPASFRGGIFVFSDAKMLSYITFYAF